MCALTGANPHVALQAPVPQVGLLCCEGWWHHPLLHSPMGIAKCVPLTHDTDHSWMEQRIPESQHGKGWKWLLGIIQTKLPPFRASFLVDIRGVQEVDALRDIGHLKQTPHMYIESARLEEVKKKGVWSEVMKGKLWCRGEKRKLSLVFGGQRAMKGKEGGN